MTGATRTTTRTPPHDVVVVGGGPTGLMLAAELALARVDVVVLERRPTGELVGTRARGVHARTVELVDQRGIADRFLAEGRTVAQLSFADTALDIAGLPTRHRYTLGLSQGRIEAILRGWVAELGVPIRYDTEVTGFHQDHDGVEVHLGDRAGLRAGYLVGADGGHSGIRKAAGIDFPGAEPTRSHLIGEATVDVTPPLGLRYDDAGIHGFSPAGADGHVGFIVTEREVGRSPEPSAAELSAALEAVYGTDFGIAPTWTSRFTDAARQAAAYRHGRVLVAGDAAHIHPPTGGQGMGLGLQDAVNVGWKLARVVHGNSPDTLLDSYHAERHPATARVIDTVLTLALLQRTDPRTDAVRATFAELLRTEAPRVRLAGLLTGLDLDYGPAGGHPLRGRRMPDLDIRTPRGPARVFRLLHDARPVLINFGTPGTVDVGPWRVTVRHLDAGYTGDWMLPVVGAVPAPAAVLVRPDGHVAWVGDGGSSGLADALEFWFGAPA